MAVVCWYLTMNHCSINSKTVWKTDQNLRDREPREGWSERLNWDAILATVAIFSISAAGWSAIAAAIFHLAR